MEIDDLACVSIKMRIFSVVYLVGSFCFCLKLLIVEVAAEFLTLSVTDIIDLPFSNLFLSLLGDDIFVVFVNFCNPSSVEAK